MVAGLGLMNKHSMLFFGFGLAVGHPPDELTGGPYDVAFRLERNEWRGVARVQANLVGLRLHQTDQAD